MKIGLLMQVQCGCTLFVGIGAIWGCIMMLWDPSGKMWGMEPLLGYLQVLPFANVLFTNFIFSGIVLLCVNGLTQLGTAYLIYKKSSYAPLASLLCGIILMLWIGLEWMLWGFDILCNIYFTIGAIQTIFAGLWIYAVKRNKCVAAEVEDVTK